MQHNVEDPPAQGYESVGLRPDPNLGPPPWDDLEPLDLPELDLEFEALLAPQPGPRHSATPAEWRGAKRDHQSAFGPGETELPEWISAIFPSFFPSITAPPPFQYFANPCLDDQGQPSVHPFLRPSNIPRVVRDEEELNSWIKARFTNSRWDPDAAAAAKPHSSYIDALARRKERQRNQPAASGAAGTLNLRASYLPKHFGSVVLRNNTDRQLHRFFITAFCPGRTLTDDDPYKTEIAPIAANSDLVKHALLSLAASYFMDFQKGSVLAERAQLHHKRAVQLLGEALSSREWGVPGNEEALTAGLMVLVLNEIINWEGTSGQQNPLWYRCGQLALQILDISDPGIKYRQPYNVQISKTRHQLVGMYMMHNVFSDCFHPLDLTAKRCPMPWLMIGSDFEQRRIMGSIGASPKLVHYFAKTTFLASRLYKNPRLQTTLKVARAIDNALDNFKQWSDVSEFYVEPERVLEPDPQDLDEDGCVTTVGQVVNLVAFAHVVAAKIYVNCRLFRRPARYPPTQELVCQVLEAVRLMPVSGPLLSAIWPLFPFFVASIVSVREEQRKSIRDTYAIFCSIARGNLTPTWVAIQHIWTWMDGNHTAEGTLDDGDTWCVADKNPWWESMVAAMHAHSGRINVA